jgi:hypothetical protein
LRSRRGWGKLQEKSNPGRLERAFGRSGGKMAVKPAEVSESGAAERLRALARRCRDLSEMTGIPEMTRELARIAEALDDEAEQTDRS